MFENLTERQRWGLALVLSLAMWALVLIDVPPRWPELELWRKVLGTMGMISLGVATLYAARNLVRSWNPERMFDAPDLPPPDEEDDDG